MHLSFRIRDPGIPIPSIQNQGPLSPATDEHVRLQRVAFTCSRRGKGGGPIASGRLQRLENESTRGEKRLGLKRRKSHQEVVGGGLKQTCSVRKPCKPLPTTWLGHIAIRALMWQSQSEASIHN